jgi:hypothetical protein
MYCSSLGLLCLEGACLIQQSLAAACKFVCSVELTAEHCAVVMCDTQQQRAHQEQDCL